LQAGFYQSWTNEDVAVRWGALGVCYKGTATDKWFEADWERRVTSAYTANRQWNWPCAY